jgi:MFS family permease
VAIHAAFKWFPNEQRTLPSGILSLGSAVGVFIAAPVLTYMIFQVSWHAAFGLLGGVGLVWVVLWLFIAEEGPITDAPVVGAALVDGPFGKKTTGVRLSYRRLFSSGTIVGTLIAGWAAYWGLALGLTWLPAYAQEVLHYSPRTIGYLTSVQWLIGGLIVFGAGAFSQWMKTRGASSRNCRGLLIAAFVALGGVCTILMSRWEPGYVQMALVVLGFSFPSVVFAIGPALISEVTPLSQRGGLLGVNTAFSTTAGLIAPFVMGWLVQKSATQSIGFEQGFLLAGLLSIGGGALGLLLLRPESDLKRLGSAVAAPSVSTAAAGGR